MKRDDHYCLGCGQFLGWAGGHFDYLHPWPRAGKMRNCQGCGSLLNMHQGATEPAIPTPGDISVCAYCGTLHKFTEDFDVRSLTTEELAEVMKSEDWPVIKEIQRTKPGLARPEHLSTLAGRFRSTRDEEERRLIAKHYNLVMEALIKQGCKEFPDMTDLLPDEYMPKDWWKRWPAEAS